MQTRATELLTEDGRVTGVLAESSDGTEYEIDADAVVLATGGYGANRDLLTDALAAVPYYGAACSTATATSWRRTWARNWFTWILARSIRRLGV